MIYKDAYYDIQASHGGRCFDSNKQYIMESNDWSHLIGDSPVVHHLGPAHGAEKIEKDVVSFITSFHCGVHAFAGILSIINSYVRQGVSNKTIIIDDRLQQGILDLIINIINPKEIIRLYQTKLYRFKSVQIIPNSLHSFLEDDTIRDEIVEVINDRIPEDDTIAESKVAVLKHSAAEMSSGRGGIPVELADEFCLNNGYTRIEPADIGEIAVINAIRQAEYLMFSWGTTHMKNFIYASEKCKRIDVFVFGPQMDNEYKYAESNGILTKKYRNATIVYHRNADLHTLKL